MPKSRIPPRRPRLWPWIVGLVALALALWGVTVLLQQDTSVEDPTRIRQPGTDVPEPAVVPAPADG